MTELDIYSQILYNYHVLRDPLKYADIILVFTSLDLRVAEYSATLYLEKHLAEKILVAGNSPVKDNQLKTDWSIPEAEKFKEVMIQMGVPEEVMLTEIKSTNSQENVEMSYELLKEDLPKTIIVVQKPTMGRRTYATFKKHWHDTNYTLMITSPPLSYEEYMDCAEKKKYINIMVGDLQRILLYPKKGFMIPLEVPQRVVEAYEELVKMGYDKHLI